MENGQPVSGSLYVYAPNKVAPVIFVVAFAASACGHALQCFHFNSWNLTGLQALCALLYTFGYVFREYGAFDYIYSNSSLAFYIVSQVLIYVCPPLLELCNYHVFGRILSYVPWAAPVPAGKVLTIFGALVALVEALNGIGVSFTSNPTATHGKQEMGSNLTIASAAIQFVVIASCLFLAALFHRRCLEAGIHTKAVSIPLRTVYASMLLILIRSIYRIVENSGDVAIRVDDPDAQQRLTPLLRYECYFYVFEASVMLLNSLLWNVWNPARYLPRRAHVYLARDGKTEVEGLVQIDTRSILAKVGCILTFGLLWRRPERQQSSVELNSYAHIEEEMSFRTDASGRQIDTDLV